MQKHKFTVVTQLHEKNNLNLIEYIEASRIEYAKALRETFYAVKHEDFNKSQYNTYLQHKYNIVMRTANSIISDAQGRFNALKERSEYEKKQLECKIEYLENVLIPKLVEQRSRNSEKLRLRKNVPLAKQRNLRLKIVAKKNKLNRLKQKLLNLNRRLESGNLKFCFGTKQLLKKDYSLFIEHRDSQISFVGAKAETCCNHNLQINYSRKNNQFSIKLRTGFATCNGSNPMDKWIYGKVYFNNYKNEIVSILKNKNSPLSYKIIKRNSRYYLYCTFEIQINETDFVTNVGNGIIGLDFNKGFVALSETNNYGHLVHTQFLPYRFKSRNKTTTDLQNITTSVVRLALQTGKSVCIENLDFKIKKSKTETRQDRKYNEVLHSLAYRKFSDIFESVAYRNKVTLIKVNPAWTSWLAEKLYCPTMKLNVHVGASYVIARRGQGFKDTL